MDDVNYHLENWYFKPIKNRKTPLLYGKYNYKSVKNINNNKKNKRIKTFPSPEKQQQKKSTKELRDENCVLSLKNNLNRSSYIFPL